MGGFESPWNVRIITKARQHTPETVPIVVLLLTVKVHQCIGCSQIHVWYYIRTLLGHSKRL